MVKKFEDMFSRFDRISVCDGQTDRQMDILRQHRVLALDLEGVHDLKLHHPSSSVATSNQ